jgi:hypothetical protein
VPVWAEWVAEATRGMGGFMICDFRNSDLAFRI